MEKSQQVKARSDKKRKEEFRKAQDRGRQKHYNMQSESTRTMMDRNKQASEQWMEKNFQRKPFFEQVKDFFQNIIPDKKPDKGLFSKKQKRKSRKNLFERIFKKKK
jgi:hypothetical protein